MSNRNVSVVQKACVFAPLEEGISIKKIVSITGLSTSKIHQICQVVYKCGYNPVTNPVYQDKFCRAQPYGVG